MPVATAGAGSISRGPGAADLPWGEEEPSHADQFDIEALPRSRTPDAVHSGLLGVGAAQPDLDAVRASAGEGTAEGVLGEAAWSRRLAPRHRRAVNGWFGGEDR